jgi:hypothetical protein
MADVTLSDSSSASINAAISDLSVLGKTPQSVIHFFRSDIIGAMNETLDQVQINSLSLGFNFQPSFSIAGGAASFKAGGGLTGEFDLYRPASAGKPSPLFPKDQFDTDIEMGTGYYLALGFQLALAAGSSATVGAFCLKLNLSATSTAKLYLPFAKTSDVYPTLKYAVESVCESFCLPSSIGDFMKLATGAVFAYDTQGTVGFQGKVDLLAAVNPTATPGVSTSYGPISIEAGPSVTIGGKFSLSGEFQVRIWKKSATVLQLSYYKKTGSSLSVSLDANVGVDTTVGGFDVISQIYGLLGDSGKLDPAWLKAHVPGSLANEVQTAYQAAVQTKLSIAIDAECDTSVTDQAAFSWNFDTAVMQPDAEVAWNHAILGDLTGLMETVTLPAGITKAGSVLDRLKDSKHTFTFNFLGLFDHASVQESNLEMTAKVSDDGQLVLTDKAHLTRLSADATPLIKGDQLRKVFAEDCVATVGYASSFGSLVPQLKVNYSYYDWQRNAQPSDLQLFVLIADKLGAPNVSNDWNAMLQSQALSQSASLQATLSYDGSAANKLFLDPNSSGRAIHDLESVGRLAMRTTPGLSLNPVLVAILSSDDQWQKVRDLGSPQAFYAALGVDQTAPPPWAIVSFTWTLHIVLWAAAMHSAGMALQAVLQYLEAHPGIYPLRDQSFLNFRQSFASLLKNAIDKTPLFNDALGLMLVYLAAAPVSKDVVINYGGSSKTYDVWPREINEAG